MNHPIKTRTIADKLADLSERVRLRLLRVLEREELSVGEVANVVQLPQSTVSRHLKVLGDGGWLVKRTEGTATLYRLIQDDLAPGARSLWAAIRDQMGRADEGGASNEALELAEDDRRLASVIAERRMDSQVFFGRVAGQWDDLRNDLFGNRFTLHGLLCLLPRDWVVADLGCGTGNASELLAPLVKQVYAIDQSAPMLKAAKKRLAAYENISFVVGEMERLPLDDKSVDAAIGVLVLHHVPDPVAALAEVRRIIRPGGLILICDMIEHDRAVFKHSMGHRWLGFSAERVEGLMREAGFVSPRFTVLPSDPEARGPGLFACAAYAPQMPGA
jgi:ubiquinone/menaquinone biosynthesis C-methylase UbiE/DNA-binding transcriptional ArsR family regulator